MQINEIFENDKKYYMNTYGSRTPVSFEYGSGMNLWDTEGRKYTDFLSGLGVSSIGHSHPKLISAIIDQAKRLLHCSNLYYIENQAKLAKVLVDNSCADKIFFSNSGAEANEGAIKLARKFYKNKNSNKYKIITFEKSFHGRTLATIAATGQDRYQEPYHPLTPGFIRIPTNDIESLKKTIDDTVCAIMLEPIQGEGGINVAEMGYIQELRKICNNKDILLIFDEVQCGLGRTGKMFAYENFDVEPDIFTLAKALGGGIPIGAVCAKEFVAQAFEPGDHGSTFGGNPLSCLAGLTVMDALLNDQILENTEKMSKYFIEGLKYLIGKYNFLTDIRGKGLMLALEVSNGKTNEIKRKCFEKGYLIGTAGSSALRFLPPLILTKEDIDGLISTLDAIMCEMSYN